MTSSKETRKLDFYKPLLVVFLCVLTFSAVQIGVSLMASSKSFSSAGTINGVGVGIYWDQACASATSSIDWGKFYPGANHNVTLYIRNEGNVPVVLSKTVSNWSPSNAANYVTLTWNYSNQTLASNAVQQIIFKLTIGSTVSGITSFSFSTTITATG